MDWLNIQRVGVAAAECSNDNRTRAHSYRELGRVLLRLSRYDDAREAFAGALELYIATRDLVGQARIRRGLAELADLQGDYALAIVYAREGLAVYEQAEHSMGKPGRSTISAFIKPISALTQRPR